MGDEQKLEVSGYVCVCVCGLVRVLVAGGTATSCGKACDVNDSEIVPVWAHAVQGQDKWYKVVLHHTAALTGGYEWISICLVSA